MKTTRVVLGAIVAGIIFFWLLPGVNRAENNPYVRIYEDTDHQELAESDTIRKVKINSGEKKKKKYKREVIQPDYSLRKLKASQFSRAIHFNEEKILDSMEVVEIQTNNSSEQIP